jgi:hypothetical protein
MVIEQRFDRFHGKGAFARLCSMLNDPRFAYGQIGSRFGVTRQYIAQLANELGINGRRRQRSRTLRREPRVIKVDYPPGIRAVIDKIRRTGFQVTPYILPIQPSTPYRTWRSLKMVIVNGVLCSIQMRKGRRLRPNGREYARFDVTNATKRAKVALWAIKKGGRTMKLYVVPLTHLRNVTSVYIPVEGKYAVGSSHKPRKDWTRYERACHLLGSAGHHGVVHVINPSPGAKTITRQ